jgi:uncharacterized protein
MKYWLRVSVLLGLFASAGSAVDWTALRPQGYVSDFADVIDPASKSQLEAYCTAVESATGAQMALVTIASLEGEPIEDVANAIYRAWGVGQKGKNEGALLLLAIGDRRNRLEVGYGLEPIVPDGFAGSVLREMRPALRQQHYGEALMAAAETIGATVAKAKNVTLTAKLPRRVHESPTDSIPWSTIIVVGLGLLVYLLRAGGHGGYGGRGDGFLTVMLLGNLMSRGSFGGRGSGGFGGFDSGDGGFGGFGGGDSGGGGASSDW